MSVTARSVVGGPGGTQDPYSARTASEKSGQAIAAQGPNGRSASTTQAIPAAGSTQTKGPLCPKCPKVRAELRPPVQCGALASRNSNPRPQSQGSWYPKPGRTPARPGKTTSVAPSSVSAVTSFGQRSSRANATQSPRVAVDPAAADQLHDRLAETDPTAPEGLTLRDVRTAAGFTGSLATVKLPADYYHAWVELHIEQGPLLERDGRASQNEEIVLGIVTNIAAPASYRYIIEGFGGHAGALLMPDRSDALCAAAELILAVERHTLAANAASHGVDSVATVGTVAAHPGAVNSVPSRVTLMLDIRDTNVARRDATMNALHADIREIEARRHVAITEDPINADIPARSDQHILDTLEDVCKQEAVPYKKMVSRAYHDSNFMARVAPIAMLFIPCRAGVSHRPDEYATPGSIALGTRILARTLAVLANE